jgi:hypothetical protein
MTTRFDNNAVNANGIPPRYGRKAKKVLQDIEDELNERDVANAAALAAIAVLSGQATTGTTTTAGEIAIAGMTANGKVIVTAAEDPGVNLVISHVVAASGKITVYTRTVVEAGTTAAAALSGKKVNYIVIAK